MNTTTLKAIVVLSLIGELLFLITGLWIPALMAAMSALTCGGAVIKRGKERV